MQNVDTNSFATDGTLKHHILFEIMEIKVVQLWISAFYVPCLILPYSCLFQLILPQLKEGFRKVT